MVADELLLCLKCYIATYIPLHLLTTEWPAFVNKISIQVNLNIRVKQNPRKGTIVFCNCVPVDVYSFSFVDLDMNIYN